LFGYDRAEVDAFLEQTAGERQRLNEDLAQLNVLLAGQEARQRELERLIALRNEVAGCLESSIGALRTATTRLSQAGVPEPLSRVLPRETRSLRSRLGSALHDFRLPTISLRWPPQLAWVSGRHLLIVVLLASALVISGSILSALFFTSGGGEKPETQASAIVLDPTTSASAATLTPVADDSLGVVLTLTATRECWLSTRVDGGQPFERTLKANETIMLRALDDAVLRVGDAGALDILINSQAAKPLGANGQVATARITRQNYSRFLTDN
jgi:hypothetical protein